LKSFIDKIMKKTSFIVAIIGVFFSIVAVIFATFFSDTYLSENRYFLYVMTGVLVVATFGITVISSKTLLEKKRIFISYSHCDNDFATKLHKILQTVSERKYSKKYRFLLDVDVISLGDDISKIITHTISSCDAFIIVFSSKSSNSKYMKNEIELITKQHNKRIIPILLSIEADNIILPESLNSIKYLSVSSMDEVALSEAAEQIIRGIRKTDK